MCLKLLSLLGVCLSVNAFAQNQENTHNSSSAKTSVSSSLEQLNQAFFAPFQVPLTNEVRLYWQGKLLGTAKVTASNQPDSPLSLMADSRLFNTLPALLPLREAIVDALKNPLMPKNTTEQAATTNSYLPTRYYCILYCANPVAQQVGLRYKASFLEAVLILPSQMVRDYYRQQKEYEKTDFSLSGNSALLSIDAGGLGSTYNNRSSHDDYFNYLFHALRGRYSLTSSQHRANHQELFASYAFEQGNLLSVGRINSQLAIPFAQGFYGVEFSSENLRHPLRTQSEVIYEDYFETNTQLQIYVDNQLITQQTVSQGYQRILAANLPAGDYDARLVFTDIYGQSREVNQRIHRSAFPTLFRRAPQWLIQTGELDVPPDVSQKTFASMMYGQQVTDNLALRVQMSLYNNTLLSTMNGLYEYDRLLSEIKISALEGNFYRILWSENLKRDWGRLSYQWEYAQGGESEAEAINTHQLNLTQRLAVAQALNTHRLNIEYRLASDWWLGTGVVLGRQQDEDIVQWRAHSSKSIKTPLFSKPMQFYVEMNYQKPPAISNGNSEHSFRVSLSQPFDMGSRTQLHSRISNIIDEQDNQNTQTGLTLTSQAITHLEQSYNISHQSQTGQQSLNIGQRYKQEFTELNAQYRIDQSCTDCSSSQQYSAGIRSNLVYSDGSVSAFRPERGNASIMVDNPSDATIALDLGAIKLAVPPYSTRAVSILPYVSYPVNYKVLSENTHADYSMTPALTELRVRPYESARVVVKQQRQQYVGLKLLDEQNQPLANRRIWVKGLTMPFMTDNQGGVVLQLLSDQNIETIDITIESNTKEQHCGLKLPTTIPATYYYAGEVRCYE